MGIVQLPPDSMFEALQCYFASRADGTPTISIYFFDFHCMCILDTGEILFANPEHRGSILAVQAWFVINRQALNDHWNGEFDAVRGRTDD